MDARLEDLTDIPVNSAQGSRCEVFQAIVTI